MRATGPLKTTQNDKNKYFVRSSTDLSTCIISVMSSKLDVALVSRGVNGLFKYEEKKTQTAEKVKLIDAFAKPILLQVNPLSSHECLNLFYFYINTDSVNEKDCEECFKACPC